MKWLIAVLMVFLLAACTGDDEPADPAPTTPTTTSGTTTPTATTAPTEDTPAKLELAPGRVGPVSVGMSKAEAAATGYFHTDVEVGGDACPRVEPLQWKAPYDKMVDVLTGENGTILSMGVLRDTTLATDKGIRVGSTLGEVNEAYGDTVSPALEAGYSQSGVFVNTGDDWLGFLFDTPLGDVNESAVVTFMEVTKGERPMLMRDGC